jgi:hypothetical protein
MSISSEYVETMYLFRIIYILLLFCCCSQMNAQATSDSFPPLGGVIAGVLYGSIFAHSQAVQNTAGAHPRGIELQRMVQQADRKAYNICRCYPRQSILASAYSFDNSVLGWSTMAAYMLEPSYRMSDWLFFSMRGAVGVAYASNPYNVISNPTNQSYSTTINAYLMYGLGLQVQVSQRTALQLTANFQHISNGGIKEPNKGVNWPTVGLHLVRYNKPLILYRGTREKNDAWRSLSWRKDVGVSGAIKRWIDEDGNSKQLPVIGAMAHIGKQVGQIHQLTAGVEWTYDGTIDKRLLVDTLPGSPHKVGLMGGHEFLLGRIIFSQQVGIYVYKDNPDADKWFHRWGLLYRAGKHYWLGFNLKAHLHVADFIDLRVVYSWR